MKKIATALVSIMMITNLSACNSNDTGNLYTPEINYENTGQNGDENNRSIKLLIDSVEFIAVLEDNETTSAFKKLLPITINMSELNNNEKYYNLPNPLPINSSNPGTIRNGDLMLYGSSTLVLFYKNFSTSYSYTRIGSIDNPSGLQSALGASDVTITFEIQR